MSDPPQAPPTIPIPSTAARRLLTTFTTFLTLSIHTLLYHRTLYPPTTFLTTRALNLPIHQSRHPGVCTWILDAVAGVSTQLQAGNVDRIVFSVHEGGKLDVVERWVFDVGSFPEWGGKADEGEEEGIEEEGLVNWTDVEEGFRGVLRRLGYKAEKMDGLPSGCTFTLAVELRDTAPAPISHPQHWIPSQPSEQRSKGKEKPPPPGAETTPIRAVQAGPLFFECWVEQRTLSRSQQRDTPDTSAAS